MAPRLAALGAALVLLAGGAAAALYFVRTRPQPVPAPRADAVPVVRAAPLAPSEIRIAVETHGIVEPRTETTLSAEVGGRVVETSPALAAGGVATAGEVLARIDRRDYELALTRARAALAQARARLLVEQATGALAKEEFKVFGKGEPDPLVLREPQIREAEAAVAAAEAGVEQSERDLARTEVKAPYAARVRRRHVAVGQRISPGEPIAVLYPL
ncbi:MAG TPA: efflux RND transporter periplasmic adaptor subunit, partial [Planctomycetota bacterium]|nr:efflux RND transporter periplasmic adaptor subunit [Planctomycetota bacterium]